MVAQIQKPAPSFTKTAVVDGVFEKISLDDYKGKWVLLAFIPLAFTFVCPTEIIAYSEAVKKFADKDTQVLFASTDSEYSLLAWTNVARKDGVDSRIDEFTSWVHAERRFITAELVVDVRSVTGSREAPLTHFDNNNTFVVPNGNLIDILAQCQTPCSLECVTQCILQSVGAAIP